MQEIQVGDRARHLRFCQCISKFTQSHSPRRAVHGDFCDHRVIVRADVIAAAHASVCTRVAREHEMC